MDLHRIRRDAEALFWAVPIQVLVMLAVSARAMPLAFDVAPVPAAILGLAVASSSSAVIAGLAGDGAMVDLSLRSALGWSGLQDVATVVLAALLCSVDGISDLPLRLALAGLAVCALAVLLVVRVLPRLLRAFADDDAAFLLVALVVARSGLIVGIARVARLPGRPVVIGTALGQMGEFGFGLATALMRGKEIGEPAFAAVVTTVALTIAGSTLALRLLGDGAGPDVAREGRPGEAGEAGAGVAEEA